jgi:hypothetical protein
MTPNTTTKVFLEDVVVLKAGLQARMPPPIKGHAETIAVRKQVRQAGENQLRPAISENHWDSRGREATWPQQMSLQVHAQHMRPFTLDLCNPGCADDHRCMPDKCPAQRHLAQFLECICQCFCCNCFYVFVFVYCFCFVICYVLFWPSSLKVKLRTIVLRRLSTCSLLPGENSSKPTTKDHGLSMLGGCRRTAYVCGVPTTKTMVHVTTSPPAPPSSHRPSHLELGLQV